MGLSIRGKKTGESHGGNYSALHQATRYLALSYCNMPDSLGTSEDIDYRMHEIDAFSFYINPYISSRGHFDPTKMSDFIFAIECAGYLFPNILLHSDCDGQYTKNGTSGPENNSELLKGNSIQLLKELEKICACENFINSDDDRIKRALAWTIEFRDLVKTEIDEGCGTIIFS